MAILQGAEGKLRRFFDEAAAYARSHAQEIPKRSDDTWRVERENGDRRLNLKHGQSPEYLLFLGNNYSDLQRFASFAQLQDLILSNSKLSAAFIGATGSGDVMWYAMFRCLLPVLAGLLKATDAGGQWDALVTERLKLLDDFLEKDTYTVQLYAPLLNFRSEVSDIEIADGIRLREISDSQLEAYINTIISFMGQSLVHQLLTLTFQLELLVEIQRLSPYLPPSESGFQASCRKLLQAFRMIRSGAIDIAFVGGDSSGPLDLGSTWMVAPRFNVSGDVYEFAVTDVPVIAELLQKGEILGSDNRFGLAMRRFMGSYEKPLNGDRLIDYWIALESLMAPDTSMELVYRLSLRTTCFIAKARERKRIFEKVKKSYNARSAFVHGSPKKVDEEIVSFTEECLRKVLLRCLALGKTPTQTVLDSLVLKDVGP